MKSYKLKVIGIPVVEHCNLNCKGCLHFCHKNQEKYFYDLGQYKKDIKQLHIFFDEVETIRLYGGEPLLHPHLEGFIEASVKEFPEAQIELITNGILLKTMRHSLTKILRKCRIQILWSIYPIITEDECREICEFLRQNKLIYSLREVKEFYRMLNIKGNSSKQELWKRCSGKHCHVMRNGLISECPAPLTTHLAKEIGFNLDFSESVLDIYDDGITAEDILEFLNIPHDVCRYCAPPSYFEWQYGEEACLNDWINNEV